MGFLNDILRKFGKSEKAETPVTAPAADVVKPDRSKLEEQRKLFNRALRKAEERFWLEYTGNKLFDDSEGSQPQAGAAASRLFFIPIRKFLNENLLSASNQRGMARLPREIQRFLDILLIELRRVFPGLYDRLQAYDLYVILDEFVQIVRGEENRSTLDPAEQMPPPRKVINQLPRPPFEFTGRQEELGNLLQAVQKGGVVITSHGAAGVGKTALALKLADMLKDQYPDARLMVELRSTSPHPISPFRALKQIIYATDRTARLPDNLTELQALYRNLLEDKRVLILLDDAGHASQVEPFLPPPPGCLVLVTARRQLSIGDLDTIDIAPLPQADAEDLLFKFAPHAGEQVAALASQCGGIPQALLMAGSFLSGRTDVPPEEYLRRLEHARQRLNLVDIEAVTQVSMDFLPRNVQLEWQLLSVFPYKFDRRAAAAVWGQGVAEGKDSLDDLLNIGLVDYDAGVHRYSLQELVRSYAWEGLGENDRYASYARHATYYLEVLRKANGLYKQRGSVRRDGLKLLDWEFENILTGRSWAASMAAQDKNAAALCAAYPEAGDQIIPMRLSPRELITWHQTAINAARPLGNLETEGHSLESLGQVHARIGDTEHALQYFENAIEIFRRSGDRRSLSRLLGNLSLARIEQGELQLAIEHCNRQLRLVRTAGDRHAELATLSRLGLAHICQNQPSATFETYNERLVIVREIGERAMEEDVLGCLGLMCIVLGKPKQAVAYFEQALVSDRDLHNPRNECANLYNLGLTLNQLGDRDRAVQRMDLAYRLYKQLDDPYSARAAKCLEAWGSAVPEDTDQGD